MKINGQDTSARPIYSLVLPRGDEQEPLIFYASPIPNMDEFKRLCPEPKPPSRYTPKGSVDDTNAPQYLDAMKSYSDKRWAYVAIKTLEPSKIEWNSVNLLNPETWTNYEQELRDALGHFEYARVVDLIEEANCLDRSKMEQARQSFFQKQAEAVKQPIPPSAPPAMQSGEPANDSE